MTSVKKIAHFSSSSHYLNALFVEHCEKAFVKTFVDADAVVEGYIDYGIWSRKSFVDSVFPSSLSLLIKVGRVQTILKSCSIVRIFLSVLDDDSFVVGVDSLTAQVVAGR